VELGPLLLREIAAFRFGNELKPLLPPNGLDCLLQQDFWKELQEHGLKNREVRDKAFRAFSERGGYPIAHAYPETPWPEMADQLNESVIHRAIQHDLIVAQKKRRRDRALLEEVFTLACRYAGDTPGPSAFVPEIRRSLKMDTGWARVLNYLDFLESALLLKLVPPLEMRRTHHQGFDKICLCDHGLRASWLKEVIPLDDAALAVSMAQDLAGHIAESVIGYYLSGLLHLDLGYYPARGLDPEVDFVLAIGQWRIPLEVKYRRHIDPLRDTKGLRAFIEKPFHRAPFGILVTLCDGVEITDPRIVALSLPSLLLLR
jgi:predicted AAA+ superfamily ATPase